MFRSLREHNRQRMPSAPRSYAGIGINTGMSELARRGVNRMVLAIIGDAVNLAHASRAPTSVTALLAHLRCDLCPLEIGSSSASVAWSAFGGQPTPTVTIYEVYNEDSEAVRAAKRAAQRFDEPSRCSTPAMSTRHAPLRTCRRCCRRPVAPLHLAHC